MRLLGLVSFALLACLAVPAEVMFGGATAAPATPTPVAIRAAHHPGFDRIVHEFKGGPPSRHQVRYVDRLRGDASELPVRIAGRHVRSFA